MNIQSNINGVREKIKAAAVNSGRGNEDILLVAVSKTKPVEDLIAAKECGIVVFGENKAQELVVKYDKIERVKWHFIGHLQKNKVKYIIDKVDLIHSVDNIELAEEINKRAAKIGRVIPVLIQVNIGREETKSGIFKEDIIEFIKKLSKYDNIFVNGLMTIPPKVDNKEQSRTYFREMKCLFDEIKNMQIHNVDFKFLSMGMTKDYDIAIEEGANIVRVGTGIFGERNYKGGV